MALQPLFSLGQTAYVKKVSNNGKAHLVIGIEKGDSTNWYFAGCSFKEVTLLPDTIKFRLIAELLTYTSDSTICDNPVFNLCNNYSTVRLQPNSKKYSLQIDALILINYIAFSSNACFYSPYPILFDIENNTEINISSNALSSVIKIYQDWFSALKRKKFRDYCYPLCGKKYEWFASRARQQKFSSTPIWDSVYDCKEL